MPEGGTGCLVDLARFMDCAGTGRQGPPVIGLRRVDTLGLVC